MQRQLAVDMRNRLEHQQHRDDRRTGQQLETQPFVALDVLRQLERAEVESDDIQPTLLLYQQGALAEF
ncbi:hypothetical protein D3C85_1665500 [compost metagenome]